MKKTFGEYLKKLRGDRNMTLREVEKIAKISNAYLSQAERGERGIPTMKVLSRLADAYGVPLSDLVEQARIEIKNEKTTKNFSQPNVRFIARGYENLSEDNKQKLKEYLQFLSSKEKK